MVTCPSSLIYLLPSPITQHDNSSVVHCLPSAALIFSASMPLYLSNNIVKFSRHLGAKLRVRTNAVACSNSVCILGKSFALELSIFFFNLANILCNTNAVMARFCEEMVSIWWMLASHDGNAPQLQPPPLSRETCSLVKGETNWMGYCTCMYTCTLLHRFCTHERCSNCLARFAVFVRRARVCCPVLSMIIVIDEFKQEKRYLVPVISYMYYIHVMYVCNVTYICMYVCIR